MIVRGLKWFGAGISIFVVGLTIAAAIILISTRTIVFASMPDPSLPAVARIDCATAAVIIGQTLNYSRRQRKELMKRYGVTKEDIQAIKDRCNIKE